MILGGVFLVLMGFVGRAHGHSIDSLIGELIVDVTTSLYSSSSFKLFSCSDEDNLVEFSQLMSNNYKLHEISKISSTSGKDSFEFINVNSQHQNLYVVDVDCPGGYDLLSEVNDREGFTAPAKWLILQDLRITDSSKHDDESNLQLEELDKMSLIFANYSLFADSEVIIGQRTEDDIVMLSSIYRPSPFRELIVEKRGRWERKNGIEIFDNRVSSRRRLNLQLTPLKANVVLTNPDTMNHLEDFKHGHTDAITKVGYSFSKLLAARMNATVTFTFTNTWGYQDKNGTWSGMTGALDRGEVDFGATGMFIVKQRVGIIEFIHLYTPDRARFVFKRPPLSHVANLFTLPFTGTVWIACIAFCCLVFMLLYMTMIWEWNKLKEIPQNERLAGDLEIKPAFGDNFLILFGAITQQGSSYEPRSIAARMVILMVLLFCFSLYVAYTANIVALLQSSSDSIKTVGDIMNSHLKVGIQDVVYNRYYFGMFEDKLRKDFYENRVKNQKHVWMSVTDGIKQLREEPFAFHSDLTMAYSVVQETFGEDEKCGFEEIDYLFVSDPTFAIRRQSPYRELFRVGALWLEETGIKQRYIQKIYKKKPPCNNQKKFFHVSTIECYAAYLTIGYGMALTFGIWILEIIWSKSFRTVDARTPEDDDDKSLSSSGSVLHEIIE